MSEEETSLLLRRDSNTEEENSLLLGGEETSLKHILGNEIIKDIENLFSKGDDEIIAYINDNKDYKILNYLFIYAIQKEKIGIIKELIKNNVKLYYEYAETKGALTHVLLNMLEFEKVLDGIKNSFYPKIEEEQWETFIEDYKTREGFTETQEPSKAQEVRNAQEAQPSKQVPKKPDFFGYFSTILFPVTSSKGGSGMSNPPNPKQEGGFRKKHKISKYKTKKFKKIYKKKKDNKKTRKYK